MHYTLYILLRYYCQIKCTQGPIKDGHFDIQWIQVIGLFASDSDPNFGFIVNHILLHCVMFSLNFTFCIDESHAKENIQFSLKCVNPKIIAYKIDCIITKRLTVEIWG